MSVLVNKTRQDIKSAVIEAAKANGYDKIVELNQKGYEKYLSKLDNILSEYKNILEAFKDIRDTQFAHFDEPKIEGARSKLTYLNLIKKHKKVFRLIHDKPYLFNNEHEKNHLYNSLFKEILDIYGVKGEDKEYIFAFYTQGTLAIILKWVENDCKDEIEKISKLIIEVINYKNEIGKNS